MPKTEEPRAWLCRKGHLLGHIEHDAQGMKLIIYRRAIDVQKPVKGAAPDVLGIVRGLIKVRCSVSGCHEEREWHADEEAIQRLFRRRDIIRMEATKEAR